MSTILKALQRLEDEKSANVERSLNEQVVARRPPPEPKRRRLGIGVAAIGGLAIAAAAVFFWFTREGSDAEVAMESPPTEAAPVAAQKVAAAEQKVAAEKPRRRASTRAAPAARERADSSEVEVSPVVQVVKRLEAPPADPAATAMSPTDAVTPAKAGAERPGRRRRSRDAAQAKADRQAAREAAQPKPAPQVAREAAQPKPAPERVADAKPAASRISGDLAPEKPAPVPPAPVEVAAVAPEPAATAASAPPAIREPEQEVVQRAELPTLGVDKTIWHPDAARRVAVVKLIDDEEVLRLKEGDAVGPLVVETIRPGGVVFNHDGVEIVYKVGG